MSKRYFVLGVRDYDDGIARPILTNVIHIGDRARKIRNEPPIHVWHYPTPRRRLVKRFFRDLVAFLVSTRYRL